MLPKRVTVLFGIALLGFATNGWTQPGTVVAWGDNRFGQASVPSGLNNVVAIASGEWHTLALKADGTLVAWGINNAGQKDIPSGLNDVVAIAAGGYHNLAVKTDGTVKAWGANEYGQSTVPAGLNNVVAVAGGWVHSVALKADGTVVAWGRTNEGQATVPSGLNNVVAISAAEYHNLALKADGTLRGWGWNGFGQANIPPSLGNNVAAIAAAGLHSLALKTDGTVTAWGWNQYGQATVSPGLSSVVAIAGGAEHSLALKSDGTVVGWGANDGWAQNDTNCANTANNCPRKYTGQIDIPAGLSNVVAIAAGVFHSVALRANDPLSLPVRFTLRKSVSPSGSGSINAAPASGDGKYDSNAVVTLTAVPSPNHVFTGWSGAASGTSNPIQITMNADKTVTATFAPAAVPSFTLSANVHPSSGGSISISPPGSTHASNAVVTLTAVPAPNHIFTGWSGAASGANNPIQITMNGNKTVTADFAPAAVPSFTLSANVHSSLGGSISISPPGPTYAPNAVVTITAVPNANHIFTGWTGAATGINNPIQITMNEDKTVTGTFAPGADPSFPLTPIVNPPSGGRVSVTPTGPGQFYRVEAIPAKGFLFSHWSGSVTSNFPELTFQMDGATELQANFVPFSASLFRGIAGNYMGLVESMELPASESSGAWRMKLGPNGTYSGRLTLDGKSYALSGKLTAGMVGHRTIKRARQTPLHVVFQVDTNQSTIAGSVTISENHGAQLFGHRAPVYSRGQASSHVGKYTLALGNGLTADEKSFGNGVAAFNVARSGSLRFAGRLADGTPFTQQSFVSEQGLFPVHASLYRTKGAVLGWITITNQSASDLEGNLVWTKHAGIPKTFFAAGFTNALVVTGSRYLPPSRTNPLLSLENGVLYLDDGNLVSALTNRIAVAGNQLRIAEPNPNKVTLRVTPGTGLFSGRFRHPNAAINSRIYGVVLQKQSVGAGFFLGNNETGSLLITEAAPTAQ